MEGSISRGKIQYVQLDASMFFTDEDFLMMNESQRGIYCSIVLFLYCKNGGIKLAGNSVIDLLPADIHKLKTISGFQKSAKVWEQDWAVIAGKFSLTDGRLTHKKVTEEINRVIEFKRVKSEAGKAGMAARWGKNRDNEPENKCVITEQYEAITKVSKGKLSKDKLSKGNIFKKPTAQEVAEYAKSIGFEKLDAQNWIDFYTSKGWMIGKNQMKDWKAAVRTWQRKESEYGKAGNRNKQAESILR